MTNDQLEVVRTPSSDAAPAFTPGPWRVVVGDEGKCHVQTDEAEPWCIASIERFCDARQLKDCHAESNANAQLIAAAPALYDVTKSALEYVETLISPSWSQETLEKMLTIRSKLRAALALATTQPDASVSALATNGESLSQASQAE